MAGPMAARRAGICPVALAHQFKGRVYHIANSPKPARMRQHDHAFFRVVENQRDTVCVAHEEGNAGDCQW